MASEGRKRSSTSTGVVIFMAAAVAFSALAGVLLSRLLGQEYSQEPLRPVVVAARDVAAGRALSAPDLRLSRWPASSIPRGAFSTRERLLQAKAVPLVPLVEGAAVLASHLSRSHAGMGVAAKLGGGKRAVAIRTDASVALAKLLYPGARVDVLATMRDREQGGRTVTILQNTEVLAVGPDIDAASANAGPAKGGGGRSAAGDERRAARRVVTLAVTPEEAERLVLASRNGAIDMVLRSPADKQVLTTPGANAAAITAGEGTGQQP